MPKIPYIIVTPDYFASAGVRCLFRLAYILSTKGYESYVTGMINNCSYSVQSIHDDAEKQYKLIEGGCITLYPEIYPTNHLSALRVAGFVGYPGRDLPYENTFYYSNAIKSNIPKNRILTINAIEKEIFNNDTPQERIWNTVWMGKGNGSELDKLCIPDIKLITYKEPSDRKELASWLKQSKVLYTFDPASCLIDEARFCGTPVVYIPNAICPTMNDFFTYLKAGSNTVYGGTGTDTVLYGIAQSNTLEDIEKARLEIPEFLKFKEGYCNEENSMIENFIALTQEM